MVVILEYLKQQKVTHRDFKVLCRFDLEFQSTGYFRWSCQTNRLRMRLCTCWIPGRRGLRANHQHQKDERVAEHRARRLETRNIRRHPIVTDKLT